MILEITPDVDDLPFEQWDWNYLIGTKEPVHLLDAIRLANGTTPMLRLVPTDVENE